MLGLTITWIIVGVLFSSFFPEELTHRNEGCCESCNWFGCSTICCCPLSLETCDCNETKRQMLHSRTAWWACIWSDRGVWYERKGTVCLVLQYFQKSQRVLTSAVSLGTTCCLTLMEQLIFFPGQGPLADLTDGPHAFFDYRHQENSLVFLWYFRCSTDLQACLPSGIDVCWMTIMRGWLQFWDCLHGLILFSFRWGLGSASCECRSSRILWIYIRVYQRKLFPTFLYS